MRLDELPLEIQMLIFSMVDPKDIVNLKLTSKAINALIKNPTEIKWLLETDIHPLDEAIVQKSNQEAEVAFLQKTKSELNPLEGNIQDILNFSPQNTRKLSDLHNCNILNTVQYDMGLWNNQNLSLLSKTGEELFINLITILGNTYSSETINGKLSTILFCLNEKLITKEALEALLNKKGNELIDFFDLKLVQLIQNKKISFDQLIQLGINFHTLNLIQKPEWLIDILSQGQEGVMRLKEQANFDSALEARERALDEKIIELANKVIEHARSFQPSCYFDEKGNLEIRGSHLEETIPVIELLAEHASSIKIEGGVAIIKYNADVVDDFLREIDQLISNTPRP